MLETDKVTFENMMISILSLMLSALGLGQAMIDLGDQNQGLLAAQRIFQSVDNASCDPLDGLSTSGVQLVNQAQGVIEFKNIFFTYRTRKTLPIYRGFSLSISQGEIVAIVGPSGSGKSTLMSLLLRFYDPDNGEVTYICMSYSYVRF